MEIVDNERNEAEKKRKLHRGEILSGLKFEMDTFAKHTHKKVRYKKKIQPAIPHVEPFDTAMHEVNEKSTSMTQEMKIGTLFLMGVGRKVSLFVILLFSRQCLK